MKSDGMMGASEQSSSGFQLETLVNSQRCKVKYKKKVAYPLRLDRCQKNKQLMTSSVFSLLFDTGQA